MFWTMKIINASNTYKIIRDENIKTSPSGKVIPSKMCQNVTVNSPKDNLVKISIRES